MLLSRAASGLVASGAGAAVEVGAKPRTFLPARTPASGNPTPSNITAKIATNRCARRIRIRMMVSISYLGRNDARAVLGTCTFNSRGVPSPRQRVSPTGRILRTTAPLDAPVVTSYARCDFMAPLHYQSLAEIASQIKSKAISPRDVVEHHLHRATTLHSQLNALVHLDDTGTRQQAEAAEAAIQRGEVLGPLHGVPLTVKSCIDVAGWPCAAGSHLRKENRPTSDAVLVQRLRNAGAIFLGNTNTPEFLMAYETDNWLSGKTSNPWNTEYSSGGSSGGEAAAIAAGCSAGGVGSDGGGSIRVPAH